MLEGDNLGLIATRQTRDVWDVLATNSIIAHKAIITTTALKNHAGRYSKDGMVWRSRDYCSCSPSCDTTGPFPNSSL
jgi:hypothetical protein